VNKYLRMLIITLITVVVSIISMFSILYITVNDFSILDYKLISSMFYCSVFIGLYLSIMGNIIFKK